MFFCYNTTMKRFNHLAVLLVVILEQMISYAWYSSYLFGESWLTAAHQETVGLNALGVTPYLTAILASIVFSYFYLLLLEELQIHTVTRSLKLAFIIWLAFLLPLLTTRYLFMGYSWNLIVVDSVLILINTILAGYILSVWKK